MAKQRKAPQYKYGDGTRSTVEIVLDALVSLGGTATKNAILQEVLRTIPEFGPQNVEPDLSTLAVNCNSRSNFGGNKLARRCDEGHPRDKIFRIAGDGETMFTLYDVSQHGVWALKPDSKGKLRPQKIRRGRSCPCEQTAAAGAAGCGV